MRAVIQRTAFSKVTVNDQPVGSAQQGFMILLGVMRDDTEEAARLLASKVAKLRVFEDENQKMNRSIIDINGEILCISQFTLCADIKKGNRPSFTPAAPPALANRLYEYFMLCLKNEGVKKVEHGTFGADMQVTLQNDGPVTVCMDTELWLHSAE